MPGEGRQLKTPETFLGENSALVNLDNLVGPTIKSNVPGMPPSAKTSNNPFLAGTSAPANPFAAQQRPSPTLNQMRVGQKTTNGDPWNLPQPLQPAKTNTSPTNPFL